MTSGNLAVFDHDVRRHLDFLGRVAGERGIAERAVTQLVSRVEAFLAAKRPGDVDIEEVRDIKRMIRESEAVAGLRTLGLEEGAARFLDLPF
jgi:glucosamine-6-phosphate deaminase